MPTEEERLLLRMEVSQRRFERQLRAISRQTAQTTKQMEAGFLKTNRRIANGFERVGDAGSAAFKRIGSLAVALGATLGTRELIRYADAWTQIGNEIAAAEQISGTSARSQQALNDIAAESRAGIEETANLYARLLRVSGTLQVSEEEVARATETVAKAFKAGGAAATEQAAGILQLSQALGSGVLQGDELRSLRENAPLVAQAIADEFETTIGGLKQLGSDGELTADRVFSAILNAQEGIEAAFDRTIPTIADGLTAVRNGLVELVGSFSQASGAGEGLAVALTDIGAFLQDSAGRAQRFGAQVAEAFQIMREAVDALSPAFGAIETATDAANAGILTMAATFAEVGATLVATANGSAAAVEQAFANMVNGVSDANLAAINSVIAALERIAGAITAQLNAVLGQINRVIGAANQIGASIPTFDELQAPTLGRVDRESVAPSRPVREAFDEAFQSTADAIDGAVRRIQYAGQVNGEPSDPRSRGYAPAGAFSPQAVNSGASQPSVLPAEPATPSGRRGSAKVDVPDLAETVDEQMTATEQTFSRALNSMLRNAETLEGALSAFGQSLLSSLSSSFSDVASRSIVGAVTGGFTGLPARATGGSVFAGSGYRINERLPGSEIFFPSQNGAILTPSQVERAIGGNTPMRSGHLSLSISLQDDMLDARIDGRSQDVATRITRAGLTEYDKGTPARVQSASRNLRKRG